MVPRAESVTRKAIPAYVRVDFYDHAVNGDKVEILFSFTLESYPCELETRSKEGMQWRRLIITIGHRMDRGFLRNFLIDPRKEYLEPARRIDDMCELHVSCLGC